MTEPVVRLETVAVACDVALNTIRRTRVDGHMPNPDALYRSCQNGIPAQAWKMSTLRAWNPAVADRCTAMLRALETLPLDAA